MNILLVEPPAVSEYGNQRIFGGNGSNKSDFKKPPLDLMMISGYLAKNEIGSNIFDANASRKVLADVKKEILKRKPDIVIFSTSTCTIYKDLLIASTAKEINKAILTVAIGTHVMATVEETFKICPDLDIIIYSSEWEQVALNIVRNKNNLEKANGIYFRNEKGTIIKTAKQSMLYNIDELGFAAHDKLDKELYRDPLTKRFPKTMVMSQKGCIGNCSFCCQPAFFNAPKIRKRSIPHVIQELKWVHELGFREIMFNDATLTADGEWSEKLFREMINQKIDLVWNCSTRSTSINEKPELLKLMKEAGCHTIMIGLESANKKVLNNINKKIKPDDVVKASNYITDAGMDVVVFAVIGFPGETKDSILETIALLKSLSATYITLGIAVPVPGTDFYRYVKDNGFLNTDDWSMYDPLKKPVFSYPDLSAEDIQYYSSFGLRQFYLRPSYILKKLRKINNIEELKINITNFIGFLKRYVISINHSR